MSTGPTVFRLVDGGKPLVKIDVFKKFKGFLGSEYSQINNQICFDQLLVGGGQRQQDRQRGRGHRRSDGAGQGQGAAKPRQPPGSRLRQGPVPGPLQSSLDTGVEISIRLVEELFGRFHQDAFLFVVHGQ